MSVVPERSSSRRWMRWIQFAIVVSLLAWAGVYAARHPDKLEVLQKVPIGYVALLGLSGAITLLLNGLYLRHIMQIFDVRLSLFESTAIAVYSSIGNYLLPMAGGLGIRGLYLKQRHRLPYAFFLSSLGTTYVLGLGLSALIGLLAVAALYIQHGIFNVIVSGSLAGILISSLGLGLLNVEIPRGRWKPLDKLADALHGWQLVRANLHLLMILIAIILLLLVNSWAALWIAFSALGIRLGFVSALLLAMLLELSIVIRVTPAGLGIREAVLVFSGTVLGIEPVTSAIAAVLLRLTGFLANLLLALVLSVLPSVHPKTSLATKEDGS